jgi:hypothetical protein
MGVLDNLQVSTLSSDEEVMNDENNQMDDQFDITNNENMLSVKIDNYTVSHINDISHLWHTDSFFLCYNRTTIHW